jgi:hypothetical protein
MEADAMTTRSQLCSFGAAVLLATMITVPAGAAPISGGALKQDVPAADRQIDAVHYRGWRHCHWRRGYRHCHGGYAYYDYDDYPYYYGYPGFYGYGFRFGHRHHHHHGHHGHHGGHRGRH